MTEQLQRNDDGAYYFEDLNAYVSPHPFVYDVAATALQRQLDRFRDVLTISLGLIAAALASIAFVLVGQMSLPDALVAGLVAIGGFFALVTACFWDPREAPNPLALSSAFETEPEYVTAVATAGVLKAIRENQRPLQIKMLLARVALWIILIAAILGVCLKVVESRSDGRQSAVPGGGCVPEVHKSGGEQPAGRFCIRRRGLG